MVSLQAQNVGHDIKYSRDTWPSILGGGGVGFSVSSEHTHTDWSRTGGGHRGDKTKESLYPTVMFQVKHSPSRLGSGKFHVLPPFHVPPWVHNQIVSPRASHASCQGWQFLATWHSFIHSFIHPLTHHSWLSVGNSKINKTWSLLL